MPFMSLIRSKGDIKKEKSLFPKFQSNFWFPFPTETISAQLLWESGRGGVLEYESDGYVPAGK